MCNISVEKTPAGRLGPMLKASTEAEVGYIKSIFVIAI